MILALLVARAVRLIARTMPKAMRDGRAAFEVSSAAYLLRV